MGGSGYTSVEPAMLYHCVSTVAHIEQTKFWLYREPFIFFGYLKTISSFPTGLEKGGYV